MYIIYRVLTNLGYQESLVLDCLKSMGEKDTWEDGLNWVSCIRLLPDMLVDCLYIVPC